MAIDYDRLMKLEIPDVEQSFTRRDTMLYALGLGFGADPMDAAQLKFVYEDGLQAVPTWGVMLAYAGFWIRELDTGIDWVKVVHGEQDVVLHRPLPVEGTVIGKTRVVDIYDKGEGKGAIVLSRRDVYDKATGDHLASMDNMSFCRGDGGFGGTSIAPPPPPPIPDRAPDAVVSLKTLPQAALIYRLSGDYNPLHADPAIAAKAGFPRPILHGLATYGVACHAVLQACCDYDPARLGAIGVRFSSPVFPGETIVTEIYRDGDAVQFRSRVAERDVIVLQNGRARLV
jgi:acyl dehydratase